jgi:LysM repeat protein
LSISLEDFSCGARNCLTTAVNTFKVKKTIALLIALRVGCFAADVQYRVHRLEPGQTMAAVARIYGIPLTLLRAANPGLDPRRLEVGTVLQVPDSPGGAPDLKVETPEGADPAPLAEPAVSPPAPSPAGEWEQVTLADGRRGWAPRTTMLIPSLAPMPAEQVVELAQRFVGTPYRWGGMSPNGVDCSGFVQEVFRLAGHPVPRLADEQFAQTAPIDSPQPGDLVFFSTYLPGPSHVGISLGGPDFLHASSSRGVLRSSLEEPYFKARYLGAHRLPSWTQSTQASSPALGP